jgi:CO/xanthine dehydrogenase Mo-binding subunit
MLHARVIRQAGVGANARRGRRSVDRGDPRARAGAARRFPRVVAPDEWDAMRAARALKASWSTPPTLIGHDAVPDWMRAGPFAGDETLVNRGAVAPVLAAADGKLASTFYWPVQSHASLGPSAAVADVRDGQATVWSASQATHRLRRICARVLALPEDKVRVVYLDGAGCYGMNGHDDASVDAAMISKALGRPVRVQWTREDEHGWDPKGPPQLLALEGALGADRRIAAWRTEMWIPKATANLPNIPLLGPEAAGIAQPQGCRPG